MRILFYYPSSHSAPEPPLGLGYLISIAKKLKHEVEFFDQEHRNKVKLQEVIKKFNPDVFAVSCMTPQYYYAQQALKIVKKLVPSCKTIIGGSHASALPVETLQETLEIDYLCAGEGEKTFKEFLIYLKNEKQGLVEIDGLYKRHNGEIINPRTRELMSLNELNNLPMPAWEVMLKNGLYKRKEPFHNKPKPVFPIITARGCPYECAFCDERSIWRRKLRERSIDNVISEILYLKQKYGAKYFKINDDTFTLKSSRVKEFCDKVNEYNIQYWIVAKVNTITQEILDCLAKSGCRLIGFGVESGDEKVLKIMKKHQTLNQVRNAFMLTNLKGMFSQAFLMVGNIGEDFESVRRTARFVKEIKPSLSSVSVMTPYPGSENYRICLNKGWIFTKDWSKWCFTPIRLKDWEPITRTDKMNRDQIKKSYYYLNKQIVLDKFRRSYGKLYFINPNFMTNEIFKRLKEIGLLGIIRHSMNFFKSNF